MSKVGDEQVVALQFRHNVEQNAFGIRFFLGVDVDVEPLTPMAHILTMVTQRVDDLFAGDQLGKGRSWHGGLCAFTVCDPGGLLGSAHREGLEVAIEIVMEGCWSKGEVLREIVGREEE